ncbi:MAG: hypothetical protein ACJ8FY_26645 [Gemmataceae bacterium]
MAILLFGVELEILKEASAAERDKFFREAALAHRARAECLRLADKQAAAEIDEKYASKLETEGKKLTAEAGKPASPEPTATAPESPKNQIPASANSNSPREGSEPKKRGIFRFRGRD